LLANTYKMSVSNNKHKKINREGFPTLIVSPIVLAAINLCMFLLTPGYAKYIVLAISVILLAILINFFRNPRRRFPSNDREKVVVAPADGEIVAIEEVDELDHFHDRRIQVSIFMSIFSVHANWFPVGGTVTRVEHQPGRYHAAFKAKSSTENERSLVVIETPDGQEVLVRQIAGAMARRVVTYPSVGDKCRIDQHMGFIKLGSRVDLYLPVDSLICVKVGQKVKADDTIVAKLP